MLRAYLSSLFEDPKLLTADHNLQKRLCKCLVGPEDKKNHLLVQLWTALLPTKRGGDQGPLQLHF